MLTRGRLVDPPTAAGLVALSTAEDLALWSRLLLVRHFRHEQASIQHGCQQQTG